MLVSVVIQANTRVSYERKTAVTAGGDLRLVHVDENLGVTQRTTTSVTASNSLLGPANGLFVDELDGGHGLGLERKYAYQPICPSFPSDANTDWPKKKRSRYTHLQLHNGLLETRTGHSPLSRLLAGCPCVGAVGGLEVTVALARLGLLLQGCIPRSNRIDRSGIGGRNVGLRFWRVRVVGLHEVLGEARHGGRVTGAGDKSWRPCRRVGRNPASGTGQHAGLYEIPFSIEHKVKKLDGGRGRRKSNNRRRPSGRAKVGGKLARLLGQSEAAQR